MEEEIIILQFSDKILVSKKCIDLVPLSASSLRIQVISTSSEYLMNESNIHIGKNKMA